MARLLKKGGGGGYGVSTMVFIISYNIDFDIRKDIPGGGGERR